MMLNESCYLRTFCIPLWTRNSTRLFLCNSHSCILRHSSVDVSNPERFILLSCLSEHFSYQQGLVNILICLFQVYSIALVVPLSANFQMNVLEIQLRYKSFWSLMMEVNCFYSVDDTPPPLIPCVIFLL